MKKMKKMKGSDIRPMIVCMDGFKMSVQNHAGSYCGNGTCEVGYLSQKEECLMRYAENPDIPTDTVYGYVPETVINEIIARHGGIDWRIIPKT